MADPYLIAPLIPCLWLAINKEECVVRKLAKNIKYDVLHKNVYKCIHKYVYVCINIFFNKHRWSI